MVLAGRGILTLGFGTDRSGVGVHKPIETRESKITRIAAHILLSFEPWMAIEVSMGNVNSYWSLQYI